MATRHNRWYISMEQAKRDYLHFDADMDDEDSRTEAYIRRASAWIEKKTDRVFYPITATRYLDYQNAKQIILGDDLISVTTLKHDDTEIASGDYILYPLNGPPYLWIEVDLSVESFSYDDTRQKVISIEGVFGYGNDTEDTGATVLNDPSLLAAGTSLTVLTGLVETGWMLLIGTEQIFVSSISTSSPNDTVTIVRAQGGTTAAVHTAATAISHYVPPWDIEDLCGQLVARLADRALQGWGDVAGTPEEGQTYMKALAAESRAIVNAYRRLVYIPVRPNL